MERNVVDDTRDLWGLQQGSAIICSVNANKMSEILVQFHSDIQNLGGRYFRR